MRFNDGREVTLFGLSEIMADLYALGRDANKETVKEIIKRLEEKGNYIPSQTDIRREYQALILKTYREYVKAEQAKENQAEKKKE